MNMKTSQMFTHERETKQSVAFHMLANLKNGRSVLRLDKQLTNNYCTGPAYKTKMSEIN